ncbi:SgcJ/EcaC family oxidoreductase [Nocardiopsis suaedae]|uniref:SgcJ/EcaC family oxidoreductase n=1 Tax=Nocardiopsis suaedae TaxID=3018444 RepID=A0ABT4TGY8_9ACTN|nr:SgcJ/EcaC family oxidoreductase [Nocardiopsis suaedae]MDA2803987.1 SgcJ/EcaC family oxidoreductase [Nocardiopsis suaedae]
MDITEFETTENAPADAEAEVEAIEKVVAGVERAQRDELPEEFLRHFRSDAVWTTGHGKRLVGREEIAAFTRRVLPGAMRGNTPRYEVLGVLFIRPDVAAVKVRQTYRGPDGERVGPEGSPLYVMAKEQGEWLLTACQNTLVAQE